MTCPSLKVMVAPGIKGGSSAPNCTGCPLPTPGLTLVPPSGMVVLCPLVSSGPFQSLLPRVSREDVKGKQLL